MKGKTAWRGREGRKGATWDIEMGLALDTIPIEWMVGNEEGAQLVNRGKW